MQNAITFGRPTLLHLSLQFAFLLLFIGNGWAEDRCRSPENGSFARADVYVKEIIERKYSIDEILSGRDLSEHEYNYIIYNIFINDGMGLIPTNETTIIDSKYRDRIDDVLNVKIINYINNFNVVGGSYIKELFNAGYIECILSMDNSYYNSFLIDSAQRRIITNRFVKSNLKSFRYASIVSSSWRKYYLKYLNRADIGVFESERLYWIRDHGLCADSSSRTNCLSKIDSYLQENAERMHLEQLEEVIWNMGIIKNGVIFVHKITN